MAERTTDDDQLTKDLRRLPPDLLEQVVAECAFRLVVALACRAARDAVRALKQGMRTTPHDVASSPETLEWARRLGCGFDDLKIASAAAARGSTLVLAGLGSMARGRWDACHAAAGARAFDTLEWMVQNGWLADVVALEHAHACGAHRAAAAMERAGAQRALAFDRRATPCGGATIVDAFVAITHTGRVASIEQRTQVPAESFVSIELSRGPDAVSDIRLVGAADGARVCVKFSYGYGSKQESLDVSRDALVVNLGLGGFPAAVHVTQPSPVACTLEWSEWYLTNEDRELFGRSVFVANELLYTGWGAWPIGSRWPRTAQQC